MDLLSRMAFENIKRQFALLAPEPEHEKGLSLSKAVIAASQGRLLHGAEREYEVWGDPANPQRLFVPWSYLANMATRDLTAGAAGSVLVDQEVRSLVLPLVSSGVGRAGATFVPGLARNQLIPAVGTSPAFEWLENESDSLTPDASMELSAVAASPNVGGIALIASRQLSKQADDLDAVLSRLLIQLGNDALDAAALNGSGTNGEPLGLLQNPDVVATVSAGSINYAGIVEMEEAVVDSDTSDDRFTWFTAPDVRKLLRQRELSVGSGPIWPERELLGHRAITSSKMPSGSLLAGDFRNLMILLFGAGLEVLVNPFSNFRSGQITFQLRLAMSVVCSYPGSFRKAIDVS